MNCPPTENVVMSAGALFGTFVGGSKMWSRCDNGCVPRVMCNAVTNYRTKQERLKISLVYERNVITM